MGTKHFTGDSVHQYSVWRATWQPYFNNLEDVNQRKLLLRMFREKGHKKNPYRKVGPMYQDIHCRSYVPVG